MAEGAGNGRQWPIALGTILTCIIGSFTVIQVVMAPLDERVVAVNQRLDGVAVSANEWRREYADSVRQEIADAIAQAEERRVRMADRQAEINTDYGQAIGEVSGRFNRFMEERGQLLGEAFAMRKQLIDHVALLDKRIQALEEAVDRMPEVNCAQSGLCTAPFGPR